MNDVETRTLPELVSALVADLATLVRKESELVRAEVSEKLNQTGRAGALMAVGAALLLGAFLVLIQALVLALSKVMDPLWASIIVGIVLIAVGYLLIRSAAKLVKPAALSPDRSVRQAQKITTLAKGQAQ